MPKGRSYSQWSTRPHSIYEKADKLLSQYDNCENRKPSDYVEQRRFSIHTNKLRGFKYDQNNNLTKQFIERDQIIKDDFEESQLKKLIQEPKNNHLKTSQLLLQKFEELKKPQQIKNVEKINSNIIHASRELVEIQSNLIETKNQRIKIKTKEMSDLNQQINMNNYMKMVYEHQEDKIMSYIHSDEQAVKANNQYRQRLERQKAQRALQERNDQLKKQTQEQNYKINRKIKYINQIVNHTDTLRTHLGKLKSQMKNLDRNRHTDYHKILMQPDLEPKEIIKNSQDIDLKIQQVNEKKRQLDRQKKKRILLDLQNKSIESKQLKRQTVLLQQYKGDLLRKFSFQITHEFNQEMFVKQMIKIIELTKAQSSNLSYQMKLTKFARNYALNYRLKHMKPKHKLKILIFIYEFHFKRKLLRRRLLITNLSLEFSAKKQFQKIQQKITKNYKTIVQFQRMFRWFRRKLEHLTFKVCQKFDYYIEHIFKKNSQQQDEFNYFKHLEDAVNFHKKPFFVNSDHYTNKDRDLVKQFGPVEAARFQNFGISRGGVDLKKQQHIKYRYKNPNSILQNKTQVIHKISYHETYLLFSFHSKFQIKGTQITLPIGYQVKDVYYQKVSNDQLIATELSVKQNIIRNFVLKCFNNYIKQYKDYDILLKDFIKHNMDLINLVRAELLLKMGVQRVIRVQKEEDELYERHRGTKLEKSWVRDHLPFGNMIHKIASTIPQGPTHPRLYTDISSDMFHILLQQMHKQFTEELKKTIG